jgi:hypothetical protein
MKFSKIHQTIVSSWEVFAICVVLFLVFRMQRDWSSAVLWVCAALHIGIALFIMMINNIFSFIRKRTVLPQLIYLLLTGWNPIFGDDLRGAIATGLTIVCILLIFKTCQIRESQLSAFNISLIITLGGFVQPQFLLLFFIVWAGFYYFHIFSLRAFLASLLGIISVYWILFAWSIYRDDRQIFLALLPDTSKIFFVSELHLSVYEWVGVGVLALALLFAWLQLLIFRISEKTQTLVMLKFLFAVTCIFLLPAFVQSEQRSYWESAACAPASLILAQYFTLTTKLHTKILMLLFVCTFLALGFLQYLPA